MPNWCENSIKIHATTPNELVKFVRKYFLKRGGNNGSLELDFNRIIHEPRSINECPSQYINNGNNHIQILKGKDWFNWYDWRCAYWGTKWNADSDGVYFSIDSIDEILTHNISDLYISCSTAWSPCVPIVLELQKYNPNIKVESSYYEPGMCFSGEIHSDGSDIDIPFDSMDDDFRKWAIREGYESVERYIDLDTDEGIVRDKNYYRNLESYE